jgi:hypothetical protein
MEVKIPPEAMEAIVAKAIFESLTPETRNALLEKAVTSLFERKRGNSYDSRTELQQLFDDATKSVAGKLVREHLETNADFVAKIDQIFKDAVERAFKDEKREAMVTAIADAIVKGVSRDRY